MPHLSLLQLLLANVFLAAGSCLQGVVGYGIGTLSAPLLFLISPLFVPAPMTLNAVVLTLLLLWREHAGLSLREVHYAIGGDVIGTALAGLTLVLINSQIFQTLFGVLILAAVASSVLGFRPRLSRRSSFIAGAASGYMGTLTAVGGPPIALIYQNERGPLIRANMSAFFLFGSCATLVALFFAGHLGVLQIKLFTMTVPGVLTGFLMSRYLVTRIPFESLRPAVLGVAAIAGTLALIRGLTTG